MYLGPPALLLYLWLELSLLHDVICCVLLCHLQGRDLRIMDPSLATSYPSAILCREKALVVSLEHIKVRNRCSHKAAR
jgi:hypothetical protein